MLEHFLAPNSLCWCLLIFSQQQYKKQGQSHTVRITINMFQQESQQTTLPDEQIDVHGMSNVLHPPLNLLQPLTHAPFLYHIFNDNNIHN